MVSPLEVVFFGDQSVEAQESIEELLNEAASSFLLPELLRSTFQAVINALPDLPCSVRPLFACRDFGELSRCNRNNEPFIQSVLSCVAQLGWALLHRERNPEFWTEQSNHVFIGVCTGSLPAIAVMTALSETDLLRTASEYVLLSLRLGVEASKRSLSYAKAPGTWAVAIFDVSLETIVGGLQKFHNSYDVPVHMSVYISTQSCSSITLSGPPTVLQLFLASESMQSARKFFLPISAAYHAKHLKLPDLDQILMHSATWSRKIPTRACVLWPSGSSVDETRTSSILRELLFQALLDIFQTPVSFDSVIKSIHSRGKGRPIRLTVIGPSRASVPFKKLLAPVEVHRFGFGTTSAREHSPVLSGKEDSIAIVGMAGKFPGAENPEELWEIIMNGLDLHKEVPPSRFNIRTHYDPSGQVKNTTLTPYGCFYEYMDLFDVTLFKMSPREAAQTDPIQRLMLITAYEALESAGYYDQGNMVTRPRIGTYYGQGGDDYRQVNSSQDIGTNYITGGIRAFGPGRVSYHFGWVGPSIIVDTACSSSAAAIHQACSSLKLNECDMALAGGANLLTCSDMFAGLSRANFLSLTGSCKTLDETADGYCRADAVATVVLKRLGDAIKDNDHILGVVRSIETNHAANASSITHPHADTQAALFRSVLRSAGIQADEIGYIEMHGTGTQAGDIAETTSITTLMQNVRSSQFPLYLGAIKPNIGHSEAASGVSSLIKGLLMMRYKTIPRHIGIKTQLNGRLPPLAKLNIQVPLESVPFSSLNRSGKATMLVNNFNATGGSTALLLEEFHPKSMIGKDPRNHHVIVTSAASEVSLARQVANLLKHLLETPQIEIPHLAYTLTARRMHHGHRFSCVVESYQELLLKLQAQVSTPVRCPTPGITPSVMFVFTGQGSQYTGMGKQLFKTCSFFRSHILDSDLLCQSLQLPSILGAFTDADADIVQNGIVQDQLALVALEVALACLFESWGIRPTAVIGHSLGEYSALCVSHVLSLADTFYLVGKRGLLIQSTCLLDKYSMIAVMSSVVEVQQDLGLQRLSNCEVACLNSPIQTVVSGPSTDIELLEQSFKTKGIKSKKLKTHYAFHSAQMETLLPDYEQIIKAVHFSKPNIPVASTLLGRIVQEQGIFDARYLCRQAREPVDFHGACRALHRLGGSDKCAIWIELGPGNACLSMIASVLGSETAKLLPTLHPRRRNWETISSVMATFYSCNGNPRWDCFHNEYRESLRLVQLPSYSFDMTSHWIQYDGDWCIRKNQTAVPTVQQETPAVQITIPRQLENDHSEQVNNGLHVAAFSRDMKDQAASEAAPDVNSVLHNALPQSEIAVYQTRYTSSLSHIPDPGVGQKPTEKPEPVMTCVTHDLKAEFSHIVSLMASEIGVDAQHMNEETLLEDLGVDSLMQISILARLQEYVNATLPRSLLMEYNTIAKLRVFFASQLPQNWTAHCRYLDPEPYKRGWWKRSHLKPAR